MMKIIASVIGPAGKFSINYSRCMSVSVAVTPKSSEYLNKMEIDRSTDGLYRLMFHKRTMKSPSRRDIALPSPLLATLLLEEWKSAPRNGTKPTAVASLVYRALDFKDDPLLVEAVRRELLDFMHTDSLCYNSPEADTASKQKELWLPLIKKIESHFNLPKGIRTSEAITAIEQDKENIDLFLDFVTNNMDSFRLAGFEGLVRLFKSFLIPCALSENLISFSDAFKAANLEAQIQADKWGSIEDCHGFHLSQQNVDASLAMIFLTTPKESQT